MKVIANLTIDSARLGDDDLLGVENELEFIKPSGIYTNFCVSGSQLAEEITQEVLNEVRFEFGLTKDEIAPHRRLYKSINKKIKEVLNG